MTVQASDYVYYEGKKYTLIDMEYGKDMAEELKKTIPDYGNYALSTACWRGYKAEYSIEDNTLYGYADPGRHKNQNKKTNRLHYTGSCIIAFDKEDWHIADFLECYMQFDEAKELHFTDGIIDGVNDLSGVCKEYQAGWIDGTIERDEDGRITAKGMETREALSLRDLKYKYGESTYKWRRPNGEEEERRKVEEAREKLDNTTLYLCMTWPLTEEEKELLDQSKEGDAVHIETEAQPTIKMIGVNYYFSVYTDKAEIVNKRDVSYQETDLIRIKALSEAYKTAIGCDVGIIVNPETEHLLINAEMVKGL